MIVGGEKDKLFKGGDFSKDTVIGSRFITYNNNSLVCPVTRGKCIDGIWRAKNEKGVF